MLETFALRLVHYIIALSTFFRQWIFRIPALWYKKQAVETSIQSDARTLKKLPLHLGFAILENDFSYVDIANLILWSVAMGISYISIYDIHGEFKRNRLKLEETISKCQSRSGDTEQTKKHICLHSSLKKNNNTGSVSCSHIDVHLLSLEDGRHYIVETAQTLCRRVAAREYRLQDINPTNLDNVFQDQVLVPDPDLVVKFGSVDSLLGFLPWQLRLTEILSLPSHIGVDYKGFKSILGSYGNTQQRFGK